MIETRFVLYDADKRLFSVIEGDMAGPARNCHCISGIANEFPPINPGTHLSALNMEDLILADMHVLKRNIASRMHGPFHCEGIFRG